MTRIRARSGYIEVDGHPGFVLWYTGWLVQLQHLPCKQLAGLPDREPGVDLVDRDTLDRVIRRHQCGTRPGSAWDSPR